MWSHSPQPFLGILVLFQIRELLDQGLFVFCRGFDRSENAPELVGDVGIQCGGSDTGGAGHHLQIEWCRCILDPLLGTRSSSTDIHDQSHFLDVAKFFGHRVTFQRGAGIVGGEKVLEISFTGNGLDDHFLSRLVAEIHVVSSVFVFRKFRLQDPDVLLDHRDACGPQCQKVQLVSFQGTVPCEGCRHGLKLALAGRIEIEGQQDIGSIFELVDFLEDIPHHRRGVFRKPDSSQ